MTCNNIAKYFISISILLTTIVFNGLISNCNGYFSCGNLKSSVCFVNLKLCRNIIFSCIFHNLCSADCVCKTADVRALRITCSETAYCVLVSLNGELKCLKSSCALFRTVINISGVAVCNNSNFIFLGTVCDRQLSCSLGCQAVVCGNIIVFTINDSQIICIRTVVICVNQSSFCCCVANRCCLAIYNVFKFTRRITILFRTVVFDRFVFYGNCDLARCDFQFSVFCFNNKLCSYIIIIRILNNSCSADCVCKVADVRALWITCCEAAYRIRVTLNGELKCLKSGCTLLRTVIDISGAAVCNHLDFIFVGTICDRQLSCRLGCQVVVACNIFFTCHDLEGFCIICTIVICINQSSL